MKLLLACAIWLLIFQPRAADAQPLNPSGWSQADVLRAVARGEGAKVLALYETQAVQFENSAEASESPGKYWRSAANAYRLASLTARYLGKFEKGIIYAEKMLALTEKPEITRLKSLAINTLLTAHQSTNNFAKASELLEFGFRVAKEMPPDSLDRIWWESSLYHIQGTLFRRQGNYESAAVAYRYAIKSREEYLTKFTGDGPQARDRVEVARTLMLNSYFGLGGAYIATGKPELALESYQRGLAAAEEWALDHPKVNLLIGVGKVLFDRHDFAGALDSLHKALDLARLQQTPERVSNAARGIGDVLRETGKPTEAVSFYREAIEQVESVRALMASQSNRQSYFGGSLQAYWGMIASQWETGAHARAFDYGERARSRSFLDLLGSKVRLVNRKSGLSEEEVALAEIRIIGPINLSAEATREYPSPSEDGGNLEERYRVILDKIRTTNSEQATLMSVEPLKLNEVQRFLDPEQTLIEYLVTPQKTYLWVVDRQHVRAHEIPISRNELVTKVQVLRTAISDLRPLKEYQAISRGFYDLFVAPVKPFIRGKEIIIVPHDVLHYVPFQALFSSDGKYLIEDHPVTYVSSASLIQFTKAKRKPVGQKVLAFGNPSFDSAKVNLPMSELETDAIRRLYPQSVAFVKGEASEEKVKALSQDYEVIHFAAHAELSKEDPLSSAVLLARGGKEDGRLEVREIFGMDLKASLVVLSGCETGLGELSSGDELVGLTRAFIYAGTPSVVASLWKVDDASTAHLMSGFYRNLKTKSKVESLRQAQLDMIRGRVNTQLLAQRGVGGVTKLGTPAVRTSTTILAAHPYFWAPFILVGDGK